MINLEFKLSSGKTEMRYDVTPSMPIDLPTDAVAVTVWLGTKPMGGPRDFSVDQL